jgi:hypothetical protein
VAVVSPVREAKGRLLSREYMADRAFMTQNTAAEREWYLLTAMFTDDAGYLPWDLPDNAANLYRYEIPAEREERVAAYVAHFIASGRFIDLGCGHARMPSVGKRPRGHRREFTIRDEHSGCSTKAFESNGLLSASSPIQSYPVQSSNDRAFGTTGEEERPPKTNGAPGPLASAYADLLRTQEGAVEPSPDELWTPDP